MSSPNPRIEQWQDLTASNVAGTRSFIDWLEGAERLTDRWFLNQCLALAIDVAGGESRIPPNVRKIRDAMLARELKSRAVLVVFSAMGKAHRVAWWFEVLPLYKQRLAAAEAAKQAGGNGSAAGE